MSRYKSRVSQETPLDWDSLSPRLGWENGWNCTLEIETQCGRFLFSPRSQGRWLLWFRRDTGVVVSKSFLFSPLLEGKWSYLTNMFQMGWQYQLEKRIFPLCKWILNIILFSTQIVLDWFAVSGNIQGTLSMFFWAAGGVIFCNLLKLIYIEPYFQSYRLLLNWNSLRDTSHDMEIIENLETLSSILQKDTLLKPGPNETSPPNVRLLRRLLFLEQKLKWNPIEMASFE